VIRRLALMMEYVSDNGTTMRIKILFDKTSENKKLHTGWGVSFLIDDKILFDTGEKGEWLLQNIRSLGVGIDKIEAVIISHDHWDHWGGLWELLKKKKGLMVYACPNFSAEFKNKVIQFKGALKETKKMAEIVDDIFVTGEIAGEYKAEYMAEQALVVRTDKGISVITGCAHPGIIKMVEKVTSEFKDYHIYSVIGGFHLMDKDTRIVKLIADKFKKMNIEKVGPTHCSGKTAQDLFKKIYGPDFIDIKVGQSLDI